jgi:hypothetical protein
MQGDHLAHYHEHGYAVVRGVFDRHEVAELARPSIGCTTGR